MQSGLRAVAGVVGQFRESQVCQVLRYRQHHNLVPLSNFLYLQMSAPWDELSGHMWEWAARPRQSGLLSSAQIRNCFCLQEAALSSGGGGWVARVSLQWDNMRYIPQQPPQPSHHKQARSGFIPSVTSTVSFTTENLACSRLIYYEKENILTFLQWHKIVIIGKRDLIIDLSLNYVSSSRLSVSPLLYSLTLVKITAIWVLWIVVLVR